MRVEISTLFHLLGSGDAVVRTAHIGDGVHIAELDPDWLESVRAQCPKVAAREQLETQNPYTHRFYYQPSNPSHDFWNATSTEQQPLLRAVSLSRLVKPTSIAYSNIWIKWIKWTLDHKGDTKHFSEPVVGAYSVAYGLREHEWNTITDDDASKMARLWSSLSFFLDDLNEPTYRRIIRALKRFELAHAIYFADLRFPLIHSALESMICTTHKHNKAQVTQRLPQLAPFVSADQAEAIYLLCCDFKHAAAAMLQDSVVAGSISPADQKRIDCVRLLHEAVREILLRALSERSFADTLADVDILTTTYKAFWNGKLITPRT
jgi:hypothetical protein